MLWSLILHLQQHQQLSTSYRLVGDPKTLNYRWTIDTAGQESVQHLLDGDPVRMTECSLSSI